MSTIIHYRCDECGKQSSPAGTDFYDDGDGKHICGECLILRGAEKLGAVEYLRAYGSPVLSPNPWGRHPSITLRYLRDKDVVMPGLAGYGDLTESEFRAIADMAFAFYVKTNEYERLHLRMYSHNSTDSEGYVYVALGIDGKYAGRHKIGMSADPQVRISTFRKQYSTKSKIVCTIKTPCQRSLEGRLHDKYRDKRVENEWFDLLEADLEYLKSLAEQSQQVNWTAA